MSSVVAPEGMWLLGMDEGVDVFATEGLLFAELFVLSMIVVFIVVEEAAFPGTTGQRRQEHKQLRITQGTLRPRAPLMVQQGSLGPGKLGSTQQV